VARVQRRGRLEQQDVRLLVGHRAVFDAAGDDEELALLQPDVTVPEFHAEAALHDEEQLVLAVMLVPDELALPGRPSAPRTGSARRPMANGGPVPACSTLPWHDTPPSPFTPATAAPVAGVGGVAGGGRGQAGNVGRRPARLLPRQRWA
jgi:hypothetical protein